MTSTLTPEPEISALRQNLQIDGAEHPSFFQALSLVYPVYGEVCRRSAEWQYHYDPVGRAEV